MPIKECKEGFTFGADPEFFLKTDKDEVIPAIDILPGTKSEPFKVENGAVQVDGLAAEFNIDPASSYEEWDRNIVSVMKQLKAMLPKGVSPHVVPHTLFSKEIMDSLSDEAKAMGCDPDYNAWSETENPTPDVSKNPLLRVAAGHVHAGWTEDADILDGKHIKHCQDLVKQFDWFLGAWSLRHDKDLTRRQLYGKAGSYRPKPYGVEYRTLSNFWITTHTRRLAVWNRMQEAVEMMPYHFYPEEQANLNEAIRNMINKGLDINWMQEDFRYPLVNLSRPQWLEV